MSLREAIIEAILSRLFGVGQWEAEEIADSILSEMQERLLG